VEEKAAMAVREAEGY
jgi:hypothetical protein